jgi:regulatory protein
MQEWGLLKISQNHILELLVQEKYVDEERYSRSFCRGKFSIKKWGKIKITNNLRKKYISEVCITKGLEEINDSEYQKELDKQYQKKKNAIKEKNHFIKKKKIATYLINKGYESNFVWDKIRELKE